MHLVCRELGSGGRARQRGACDNDDDDGDDKRNGRVEGGQYFRGVEPARRLSELGPRLRKTQRPVRHKDRHPRGAAPLQPGFLNPPRSPIRPSSAAVMLVGGEGRHRNRPSSFVALRNGGPTEPPSFGLEPAERLLADVDERVELGQPEWPTRLRPCICSRAVCTCAGGRLGLRVMLIQERKGGQGQVRVERVWRGVSESVQRAQNDPEAQRGKVVPGVVEEGGGVSRRAAKDGSDLGAADVSG